MIDFSDSTLETLVVHKVGNPIQEETLTLSKTPVSIIDDTIRELLHKYFLTPFKQATFFNFQHEADINLNEVYNYSEKIFNDPDSTFLQSINLAKHLFEATDHPNIKGGEMYIAYFSDCKVDGDYTDAIGIFKSENKETYLKVMQQDDVFELDHEAGININKLDKGCIIFDQDKEKGYKVCMVDSTNRNNEAQYWREKFLNIKPREDNYFHTENFLSACRGFCDEVLSTENEVSKADQLLVKEKSYNYFKEKEEFNIQDFQNEVMQEPELIDAFSEYKNNFFESHDINHFDEFNISKPAINKQKKFFRSVIKLDKNFHVYVHGNHDYIERGYDEVRDLNYYTLYFKKES